MAASETAYRWSVCCGVVRKGLHVSVHQTVGCCTIPGIDVFFVPLTITRLLHLGSLRYSTRYSTVY